MRSIQTSSLFQTTVQKYLISFAQMKHLLYIRELFANSVGDKLLLIIHTIYVWLILRSLLDLE